MEEYKIYLAGKWKDTARYEEVINPYNHQVIGKVCQAGEPEVEEAIKKGLEGLEITKRLPAYKRYEILTEISAGIKQDREKIARILTLESGKPISDARVEVNRAVNTFRIAAEEAKRIEGNNIPLDIMAGSENRVGITQRFPIGLILGITPFNFPLNLVAHKIAPAIASGNPIILKPASKTPITSLLLGEIIARTELPKGGVSILPCPARLAEQMVIDPRIKMVTFTGSPKVGWYLKEKAGKKKVLLELGGNAGVIVEPDADLPYTIKRCVTGAFSYAGQVCISVQRIYIQEDIFPEFTKEFVSQAKGLKTGDPINEDTNIGPMIDLYAAKRVEAWVNEAKEQGAKVLAGGKRDGNFFEPTILADTTPEMNVNSLEAFAPLVTLTPYKRFDDAIAHLNNSRYGLQAGLFSRDMTKIFQAFREIEVGGLIVNDVPTYRADHMPYGGIKESGVGREGIRYAIEEMTELKLLALNMS
ncbi:MAG: aldehyde dehydrogenase family protein [Nitrospirota bacterium]